MKRISVMISIVCIVSMFVFSACGKKEDMISNKIELQMNTEEVSQNNPETGAQGENPLEEHQNSQEIPWRSNGQMKSAKRF